MRSSQPVLTENAMTGVWRRRDAGYDGVFCFGVKTTGIFCRPSCPSKPRRENMEFFRSAGEAVRAGYRPCKRCQPELADGALSGHGGGVWRKHHLLDLERTGKLPTSS